MSVLVQIPSFDEAWGRLHACHISGRTLEGPKHLRLLGQTGVGKTFVLLRYVDAYPPYRADDRYIVPVLLVRVPAAPTLKGLYQAILTSLGTQGGGGSIEALRHRAITLIRNLRVELLLLDEINHVLDRGARRTQELITDSIKEFVDAIGIPTVFSGAKRAEKLFQSNAQLRSRVTASHTLQPFNIGKQFDDLRGFIKAKLLIRLSEEQANWMASEAMAVRHFYATDGIHRQLSEFLDVTPRWTLEQACGDTFLPKLATLFRNQLWENAPSRLNPYCPEFIYRRLNGAGEPYAPTILDGDNHEEATCP